MPNAATQKVSKRTEIADQQTFRFSTPDLSPASSPDRIYMADPRTNNQLLNALGSFSTALKAYAGYRQLKNVEEEKAGERAQLRGDQLNPDDPTHKVIGYERMAGQAALLDLRGELTQYFNDNMNRPVDEFIAGRDEILNKYINGASDAFLQGFIPGARNIEDRFNAKYQERQAELVRNEARTLAAKMSREKITTAIELKQTSPENMFALLKDIQKQAATLGLSEDEVNEQFVDAAGQLALRRNDMNLMNFGDVKDPKTGATLADSGLGKKIQAYQSAAENAWRRKVRWNQAQSDRAKRLRGEALQKKMVMLLHDSKEGRVDPTQLAGVEAAIIASAPHINASSFGGLMRTLDAISSTQGFPETSTPEGSIAAIQAAVNGDTSTETWNSLVENKQLSREEFSRYYARASEAKSRMEQQEKTKEEASFRNQMNFQIGNMKQRFMVKETVGGEGGNFDMERVKLVLDAKKYSFAVATFQEAAEKFYADNNRPPSPTELYKMKEEAVKAAGGLDADPVQAAGGSDRIEGGGDRGITLPPKPADPEVRSLLDQLKELSGIGGSEAPATEATEDAAKSSWERMTQYALANDEGGALAGAEARMRESAALTAREKHLLAGTGPERPFADVVTRAGEVYGEKFSDKASAVGEAFSGAASSAGETFSSAVQGVIDSLTQTWEDISSPDAREAWVAMAERANKEGTSDGFFAAMKKTAPEAKKIQKVIERIPSQEDRILDSAIVLSNLIKPSEMVETAEQAMKMRPNDLYMVAETVLPGVKQQGLWPMQPLSQESTGRVFKDFLTNIQEEIGEQRFNQAWLAAVQPDMIAERVLANMTGFNYKDAEVVKEPDYYRAVPGKKNLVRVEGKEKYVAKVAQLFRSEAPLSVVQPVNTILRFLDRVNAPGLVQNAMINALRNNGGEE